MSVYNNILRVTFVHFLHRKVLRLVSSASSMIVLFKSHYISICSVFPLYVYVYIIYFILLLDWDFMSAAGSLLERRDALPGYNFLDIIIEKIGLKDPQNYIDPLITVSVKSKCLCVYLT